MPKEALEVWKTLRFKSIPCKFNTLKEHLHDLKISFYGTTGNVEPQGSLSPEGEASLALVCPNEHLRFSENDQYSYLDLLKRAAQFGLRPARPCIAPQLLFEDGAEYPAGFEVLIASDPKEVRPPGVGGCFAVFGFGTKSEGPRYLEVAPLSDPADPTNFTGLLFVFEIP